MCPSVARLARRRDHHHQCWHQPVDTRHLCQSLTRCEAVDGGRQRALQGSQLVVDGNAERLEHTRGGVDGAPAADAPPGPGVPTACTPAHPQVGDPSTQLSFGVEGQGVAERPGLVNEMKLLISRTLLKLQNGILHECGC